jgi:hypothetical protein
MPPSGIDTVDHESIVSYQCSFIRKQSNWSIESRSQKQGPAGDSVKLGWELWPVAEQLSKVLDPGEAGIRNLQSSSIDFPTHQIVLSLMSIFPSRSPRSPCDTSSSDIELYVKSRCCASVASLRFRGCQLPASRRSSIFPESPP